MDNCRGDVYQAGAVATEGEESVSKGCFISRLLRNDKNSCVLRPRVQSLFFWSLFQNYERECKGPKAERASVIKKKT